MSFLLSEGMNYHIDNNLPIRESVYRPGSQSFFSFIIEAKNAYRQGLIEVDQWDHDLLTSDIGEYGEFNGGFVPLDYPIPAELDLISENVEKILTKIFNNEFGNEIEIEIRDLKQEDFLDMPNENPYDGVYIKMTGPSTETENMITRMEAQNLLLLLQNYFEEDLIESKKQTNSGSLYKGKKVKLNKPKRGGSKKFYVYVKNPKTGRVKKIEFGAPGMSVGLKDPKRRKSFAARHQCEKKNDKTKAGYWACRIGRYPNLFGGKSKYTWW